MLSRILRTKGKQKTNRTFCLLKARRNGAAVSKTAVLKRSHEHGIGDILAFQLCFSANAFHLFVSTYFPFSTFFKTEFFLIACLFTVHLKPDLDFCRHMAVYKSIH